MCSVLFSLALMLVLAVTASAATITIDGGTQADLGGAGRFQAYQVFTGNLGGSVSKTNELAGITWGDGVEAKALVEALKKSNLPVTDADGSGMFGEKFTNAWNAWSAEHGDAISDAELVAQFLSKHNSTSYGNAFARIAAQNTKGVGITSVATAGGWQITVDEDGYYLVKDLYTSQEGNDKPDGAVSSYILQVLGNQTVGIKSSIPTVEKKVEGQDGYLTETNKEVTFTLTGTVAQNIEEYGKYFYKFTDTLSAGFDFGLVNNSNLNVKLDGMYQFAQGTDYRVDLKEGTEAGTHVLTVTFEDLIAAVEKAASEDVKLSKDSKIVVTYQAKLNKSAVIGKTGNPNDVKLEYSNDPYATGTGESVPDEVKTYTLGLDVVKYNDDKTPAPLENVKFKLKNGTGDYAVLEEQKDAEGKTGYYAITGWDATGTELVTDAEGAFHIHGLSTGTYTLVETEAPKDYETMKDVVFDITGGTINADGSLGNLDWNLNKENEHRTDASFSGVLTSGTATLTLTNYKAPILPNTGGIGAKIVYVVSGLAVLVGACIVLLALKKRKGDKA